MTTINVLKAIDNKNRKKILDLLETRPHTISEISRQLGMGYTPTRKHIRVLKKAGLIETKQNIKKRGSPTLVMLAKRDGMMDVFKSIIQMIPSKRRRETELGLLKTLKLADREVTLREVATHLGMDKMYISGFIGLLQLKGLIKVRTAMEITNKGKKKLKELKKT